MSGIGILVKSSSEIYWVQRCIWHLNPVCCWPIQLNTLMSVSEKGQCTDLKSWEPKHRARCICSWPSIQFMRGMALKVNLTGMILIDSESSDEAPPRKLTETGLTFLWWMYLHLGNMISSHNKKWKMVFNQVQTCMRMFYGERFIDTEN